MIKTLATPPGLARGFKSSNLVTESSLYSSGTMQLVDRKVLKIWEESNSILLSVCSWPGHLLF